MTGETNVVRFRRLDPKAKAPVRKHEGDAGADLASIIDITLRPGERALVPTGIAVELPAGHLAYVVPRSGLAARNGITIVNAPGLVDTGYRGELKVCLMNTGSEDFHVTKGDRIAQLVIQRYLPAEYVEAEELTGTDRGEGGFGSTGVKD